MIFSIIILSVFSLFSLIVVGYLVNKIYKMRESLVEKDMEIMNLNMELDVLRPSWFGWVGSREKGNSIMEAYMESQGPEKIILHEGDLPRHNFMSYPPMVLPDGKVKAGVLGK